MTAGTRPVFGHPVDATARRRAAKEAKWNEAYRKADTLYTAKECGCLVLIMVDLPDVIRHSRDDILRESMAGRALRRVPRGQLPPLNCPAHSKEPSR